MLEFNLAVIQQPLLFCSILQVYSKVSGDQPPETSTIDVSSKEFYGEGYDDSDKRIPDMTIINQQLGKFRFRFPIHPSSVVDPIWSSTFQVNLLVQDGIQRLRSGTCSNRHSPISTGHMQKPSRKWLHNQLQVRRFKQKHQWQCQKGSVTYPSTLHYILLFLNFYIYGKFNVELCSGKQVMAFFMYKGKVSFCPLFSFPCRCYRGRWSLLCLSFFPVQL